ncbi:Alpha/beta hydrolase fold-1 [Penicillium herquei]|nr:Alpha/beta hydrolase fold-1 [Penicillium herquei]
MVDYVPINGAQLAYRLIGPQDAPLIITLHGGRGFAYSPLSTKYRVLSFDYRGHGQSSRTEPYTFHQLVEDIEALRFFFADDKPCIICGGSFGGYLAQQYAITYPDKVSHLILRGTAPSYHHEEMAIRTLEQRVSRAPSFSINFLREKVFGRFESDLEFQLVMFAAAPLYSEHFDAEAALKNNLSTVFYAKSHKDDLYSETEKYFDYREKLHLITADTLIIVGERDWICPPDQSKDIAARIPNAHLDIIPNANHSVHLEKNDEVIRLIRWYLG